MFGSNIAEEDHGAVPVVVPPQPALVPVRRTTSTLSRGTTRCLGIWWRRETASGPRCTLPGALRRSPFLVWFRARCHEASTLYELRAGFLSQCEVPSLHTQNWHSTFMTCVALTSDTQLHI